ncbi:inositol monophosphatase [Natronolimnohabitans innermongolicus JCM 12255]|uniref:Inositol monophosphatase n=1 Tax=Natronolimnohabitans innermongolicus JCM 12255 TaxID=1227499 RepID=L9WYG1_9EURY|nr:inositol monophosphatase [Natronolimnohabitans innermongolicus JCM 12255]
MTVLESDTETDATPLEPAGKTVLGVVYVPLLDDRYVARHDAGVRYDGRRVEPTDDGAAPAPETATVASVIGHDVKRNSEQAAVSESINRALEARCKRRLESWSPTVHWGLLARRRLDGVVCYRPDRAEQLLGELFARESGLATESGETADGGTWFVAAGTEPVFDALCEVVDETV